jgi:hypothetical protein
MEKATALGKQTGKNKLEDLNKWWQTLT